MILFPLTVALAQWQRHAMGCGAAMLLSMGLGRFSFAGMIPALVAQGKMTLPQAGIIGGFNLVGFLIGALLLIVLIRKVKPPVVFRCAVWLTVAGLLASSVEVGYLWLLCWRAIIGLCTGAIMVLSLAIALQAAPIDGRAQAAAYVFVGVGMGILFTGAALPVLLDFGLQACWLGIATAGLLAAICSSTLLRGLKLQWVLASERNGAHQQFSQRFRWPRLVVASFLYSFGVVPHTVYWFDYLARGLNLGVGSAGRHWIAVGVCSIVGPLCAAALARRYGNRLATVMAFLVLAIGVALPWIASTLVALVVSTILFGLQPGVSTMIAARAREVRSAANSIETMQTIIIANGLGAAVGGVLFPALLLHSGTVSGLFLVAAFTLLVGALLCVD